MNKKWVYTGDPIYRNMPTYAVLHLIASIPAALRNQLRNGPGIMSSMIPGAAHDHGPWPCVLSKWPLLFPGWHGRVVEADLEIQLSLPPYGSWLFPTHISFFQGLRLYTFQRKSQCKCTLFVSTVYFLRVESRSQDKTISAPSLSKCQCNPSPPLSLSTLAKELTGNRGQAGPSSNSLLSKKSTQAPSAMEGQERYNLIPTFL